MAALLVVSRFRIGADDAAAWLSAASTAVDVLARQPGCRGAAIGQSTDDAGLLLIRTEWDGVGAYRRALSSFDVKVHAVPFLSGAIDESSAYEIVRDWSQGGLTIAESGLAADSGSVELGQAAGPDVPSVSS